MQLHPARGAVIYYNLNDKAPKNVQAIGLAHWLNVQTAIFRKEMSVCAILDGLIPFLTEGAGDFPLSHGSDVTSVFCSF